MRMLSPLDVFEEFDRIANAFATPAARVRTGGFQPSCDVSETKGSFILSFDVPGVKKEDIKIEVRGNQLVISGERRRETRDEDNQFPHRFERTYGKFERTFDLHASVDADRIEAHYENGVLNVAIPKAEAARGRTVQIQTGQDGFFSRFLGVKKDSPKELKDVSAS